MNIERRFGVGAKDRFVVRKGECTATELMEYVAGLVAPYKKVRAVEFVEKIPKSASGKILRRELIALERSRSVTR